MIQSGLAKEGGFKVVLPINPNQEHLKKIRVYIHVCISHGIAYI